MSLPMPPTMPSGEAPSTTPLLAGVLLLVLTAALLLLRLGEVPLLGPDEPRYVRVAVEMHRSGDWVTPTLAGVPWLEKPVLYYWLAGAAFSLFGEGEAAARFPSVLAALLLVGATALFGSRLYGRAAGLHAGFILATSLLFFAFGRAASMDMLLAAFVTVAIGLAALAVLRIAGRLAIPVAWGFAGLAALAKGPIGLLLPALVIAVYVLLTREWRLVRKLLSPSGVALFLIVAGPWYALIYRAQGQAFLDVFLLNHNLQRFTSTVHNHPGPVVYYLPVLLAGLFPWSGLVFPAFGAARPRTSKADLVVLLWLVVPLVFFSAAGSKLPGYILPCLAPLALLMGRGAAELVRDATALPFGTGPRAVALVGLVLGSLVATTPVLLLRAGEPSWMLMAPAAAWSLIIALGTSRALSRDPAGAFRLLRVGGAGFLVLLTTAAPAILARQQSGRDLFIPAQGREVLVWGAWRTAWMAGYYYNDGHVREVAGLAAIAEAAGKEPVLVLAGPSERRQLGAATSLDAVPLATDFRGDTLLKVKAR
jgi:4-amino-4-deoxy-L-arabinose transferase-like glycosyltransferase